MFLVSLITLLIIKLRFPRHKPINQTYGFSLKKSNARSPSDADMNHKNRFLQVIRHKRQVFLPYFSVPIYVQTRVCYICYIQLFAKLVTY